MKANLKKEFKKGFILSEENVIKINDIIVRRLAGKNPGGRIQFKIFLNDSLEKMGTVYLIHSSKIIQQGKTRQIYF